MRQQFALVFSARPTGGVPHEDMVETSEAGWMAVADLARLPIGPAARRWIAAGLASGNGPRLT